MKNLNEISSVLIWQLPLTDYNHNDVGVGIQLSRMADTVVNFLGAVDLFHGGSCYLHG